MWEKCEEQEEEEEENYYYLKEKPCFCLPRREKCEIDSIETGAAVVSVTLVATRFFSFFFWSSRHGLHFNIFPSFFSFFFFLSLFLPRRLYLVDGTKHSDSGDQSGRLCARVFPIVCRVVFANERHNLQISGWIK